MEIKEPKEFWSIAKQYIIEKANELDSTKSKYYLDKQTAMRCIKFTSLLKHTAGKLENKNFQFSDWQIKAIVNIFGQKFRDGEYKDLRRYQRALFHMPKKNGKTETGAVFHLIMFFLEPSLSKEQYCIASDKEQALILHEAIETMIKSSELGLKDEIEKTTVQPPRITKTDESGVYKQTIMSLAKPQGDEKDGKKVTFFTSDEGHAHANKNLYQLIKNGMALVEEPLEINLSTSGYNLNGYYHTDIYQYACKVRDGIINDERFYAEIFELEESDYLDKDGNEIVGFWKDRGLWGKVNPNIGVSPTYSFLEGLVSEAENSEESLVAFLTKHLNLWRDKPTTWIAHSVWIANQTPINEDDLQGQKCYAGLDLASTTDIAALVLLFPKDGGAYDIVTRFWIPKDNMRERVRRDKVPYLDWVKKCLITPTAGNVIDYDFIFKDIQDLAEKFDIKMLAYDRWNSSDLIKKLTEEDMTDLVQFGQGYASMSSPTKQIEVLSLQEKLNHGNNEVLNWMCSNVVLKRDPAGNVKIDKDKSIEKVDGMVSLAMSLGVCIIDTQDEEVSVFEERGLRDLS